MKVVLASKNKHKLVEISKITQQFDMELVLQSELGVDIDVEETGTTFEENSFIKAEAVMKATGLPALADDSGIAVDALNGEPGIYSARYAGEECDDARNNEKLLERMKNVLSDVQVDEQRLLTEAAIYADKIAVAEETVRLRSHIDQMHEFMKSEVAIGRKMDFLVQEFNREANTIGSKAQDVEIARRVIDIKAEVEKIREQVQNIE